MKNYKVHPAAECFRVMTDEELASLAADIEENGLRDPIVLGKVNGDAAVMVDGRNRFKACEIAGVDPRFETIEFKDDDEVRAFVRSRGERRDITKGQRAMALAMLYPEPEKGGRGKKGKATETLGFSTMRLSQARAILAHSRDLAVAVRDGSARFDEALEAVKVAKDNLESNETKLARLRKEASDLADLVDEERVSIGEAISALEQRKREAAQAEQNKRETIFRLSEAAYQGTIAWAADGFRDDVRARLDDPEFREQMAERLRLDRKNLKSIATGARALMAVLTLIAKKGKRS